MRWLAAIAARLWISACGSILLDSGEVYCWGERFHGARVGGNMVARTAARIEGIADASALAATWYDARAVVAWDLAPVPVSL